jgi:hypothetical protein
MSSIFIRIVTILLFLQFVSGVARSWQLPTGLYGTRAIDQCRKVLIPVPIARLIKYLKVEEYIREILEKKRASLTVS